MGNGRAGGMPVAAFLLAVLLGLIVVYAWVSDDAYITLRTVDHFIAGRGLVWNPGDRVQAYTHPLWMLLLAVGYFFTHEAFYTTLVISILVTLLAVLKLRSSLLPHPSGAALVFLILALSRAFVDYSTSGLENPLTHLLVITFYGLYLSGRSLRSLAWVASLTVLSRLDAGLLLLPGLLLSSFDGFRAQGRKFLPELLAAVFIGGAPFWIWELFSLVYYGSLVPNTALAKLGHGYPRDEVLVRGFLYLRDAIRHDPLTSVTILGSLCLPLFSRHRQHLAIAAGGLLYLSYLVWIGGDFMRGRLLTAPLVVALILLGQVPLRSRAVVWGLVGAVLTLGLVGYHPTPFLLHRPTTDPKAEKHWGTAALTALGIADERGYYGDHTGLLAVGFRGGGPDHEWRREGETLDPEPQPGEPRSVAIATSVGLLGFYAKEPITIIDTFALADPLLSRLPAQRQVSWRVGHFSRVVPEGYPETLRTGRSRFQDPKLGQLWEQIDTVIRGPIMSVDRLRAIWRLHTGLARDLVDWERYRYAGAKETTLARISRSSPARRFGFGDTGILLTVRNWLRDPTLELALSAGIYDVVLYCNGERGDRQRVEPDVQARRRSDPTVPVSGVTIDLSGLDDRSCIDRIRILPVRGDGPYFLSTLDRQPRDPTSSSLQ